MDKDLPAWFGKVRRIQDKIDRERDEIRRGFPSSSSTPPPGILNNPFTPTQNSGEN